jgi:hypothetical protein
MPVVFKTRLFVLFSGSMQIPRLGSLKVIAILLRLLQYPLVTYSRQRRLLGNIQKDIFGSLRHQVQNPEFLRFVPKAQTGTVIWTSHDSAIINSIAVKKGAEVGVMTDREVLDLFQTWSRQREHGTT